MLEAIELETAANPAIAIIWLHGLGADGSDFVPMVGQFQAAGCPPIRFIFPHAPMMPVTVNNGYVMRAWYDILGADLTRREDEAGVRASQAAIEELIAAQIARGIASERILLAGFSQGGAIALHTGLHYEQRLAGILALSTWLPLRNELTDDTSNINQGIPVFIGHGKNDSVVPLLRAQEARDLLIKLGYAVTGHDYAMAHSVCLEEIFDIEAWLKTALNTF